MHISGAPSLLRRRGSGTPFASPDAVPSQLALFNTQTPTPRTPSPVSWRRRRPEKSVLYDVVRSELETFLALADATGKGIPRFVERELRAYLECGLLCFGFVRVRCNDCGFDRLVAFSCKGRGFCPSCAGRRMADTAAHLADRVLPTVPVRQWVVSFPWALRFRLAYDRDLCSAVLRLFIRTVFSSLRKRARSRLGPDAPRARCGAVTFVQRFGDALNLNLHFHTLVLDGVYLPDEASGCARFHVPPHPTTPRSNVSPPPRLAQSPTSS